MPSYYNSNGNKAVIKQFFVDPAPILLGDSTSTTLVDGVLPPNLTRNLTQFSDSEPLSHFYNEFASGPYPGYFAGEFRMDLTKSWEGSSAFAVRTEYFIQNSYIDPSENIRQKFQIYIDPSFADEDRRVALMQYHSGGGVGSPTLVIGCKSGMWDITVRGGGHDSATGVTFFNLGPITKGVWHEFIVYTIFSNDINVGRTIVWLNGELATLYNPDTGQPWIIPTSSNPVSGFYTLYPEKGVILQERNGASLFNLAGKTSFPDHTTKFLKFGGYISDTSDLFDANGNYNGNVDAQYLDKRFRFSDIRLITDDDKDGGGDYVIDDYTAYRALKHDGSDPTDIPVGGFTGSPGAGPTTYNISVNQANGGNTVTEPESGTEGTEITLTATLDSGFEFDKFEVSGVGDVLTNPGTFLLPDSNVTVTPVYIEEGDPAPPPSGSFRFVYAGDFYPTELWEAYGQIKALNGNIGATLPTVKNQVFRLLQFNWDLLSVPFGNKDNALKSIIGPDLTVSGGGNGSRWNEAGLLVTELPNNRPRYTYNPSTGIYEGVYLEISNTNLIESSFDLSDSWWVNKINCALSAQLSELTDKNETVFEENNFSSDICRVSVPALLTVGEIRTSSIIVKNIDADFVYIGGSATLPEIERTVIFNIRDKLVHRLGDVFLGASIKELQNGYILLNCNFVTQSTIRGFAIGMASPDGNQVTYSGSLGRKFIISNSQTTLGNFQYIIY
jgi:hypothetical protein